MKNTLDPSFRYVTARHTNTRALFDRIQGQRQSDRSTATESGPLTASIAIAFREQKTGTRKKRLSGAES